MKRKSIKNIHNYPVPHRLDLFGDVVVLESEVIQWVETIAKLPANSPRFEWYVKNWSVVDKIKRCKLEYVTLDQYFLLSAANDAHY